VVEHTPATPAEPASGQTSRADGSGDAGAQPQQQPRAGFVARGRLRRRARFLRTARELAYRDLGGLVFSLHRFGQRNDALVLAKLTTLGQIDTELRAVESALGETQPITVLHEAGVTACARCAAIHSSEDHYCPNCGLPLSRRVDLPVAGPPSAPGSSQRAQPAGAHATDAVAQPVPAGTPGATPLPAPAAGSAARSAAFAKQPPNAPTPPVRMPAAPVAAQPPAAASKTEDSAAADERQQTEVFERTPPGSAAAPVAGRPAGAPAPLREEPATQSAGPSAPPTQSERPTAPDDEQPTEIVRPNSPAGP
jgi:hypothetical protein